MSAERTSFPWVKIIHYGVFGLLAVGAVAYFLLRRSDEDDYDEYGEDAFRYETEEVGSGQAPM